MAISRALLKIRYANGRCILCSSEVGKVTVGNLCNSCKDGFAANFMPKSFRNEFAM